MRRTGPPPRHNAGMDAERTTTPAPAADEMYQQTADGWEHVDPAAADEMYQQTAESEARWVIAADLPSLVESARAHSLAAATHVLLTQRVERLGTAGHHLSAFAHVDRSRAGDLLMSIPTAWYDEDTRDVHTGAVTFVITDHLILTAETGDAQVLSSACERLMDRVPTPDTGVREVVAALLLTLLAQAAEVELGLSEAVSQTEALVFSQHHEDPVERIYDLKREIAEARHAVNPILSLLPELESQSDDQDEAHQLWSWLGRVQAGADRLDRHLDGQDHLLGDMLSAHLSQVSVQQNEDMRKISAWAAMIAVPTLVVGVYGMNFQHMPELTWVFGYPLALVFMSTVCAVLYRAFRRSGWL